MFNINENVIFAKLINFDSPAFKSDVLLQFNDSILFYLN